MEVARRACIALNAEQPLWQGSAHRPGPSPKGRGSGAGQSAGLGLGVPICQMGALVTQM